MQCLSTHGSGAGYAPGSYWDGNTIVCGACGWRIEHPNRIGAISHPIRAQKRWDRILQWFGLQLITYQYEDVWPEFILGIRGKSWEGPAPKPGHLYYSIE